MLSERTLLAPLLLITTTEKGIHFSYGGCLNLMLIKLEWWKLSSKGIVSFLSFSMLISQFSNQNESL